MPLLAAVGLLVNMARAVWGALKDPETRGIVLLALILIGIGTSFYRAVEGWSWIDALYFSVITLATVGYGDFTPKTDAGKLFTIVYILLGLGVLASFISVIARYQTERLRSRRIGRVGEGKNDQSTE